MLTSTLLFSSCFYYANYSQRVTRTHTRFLTCKFVFKGQRIITHFSLCSNTLSSLQGSSTELFPVMSMCILQVSALLLRNQIKNSLIENESTSCLETTSAPRERTRMLSLPSQVLPPHPGTSALQGWLCHSGCSPLCNWDVMGEEHIQQIYKKFELLLRTVIHWPPCCHKGKCSQHSDKRGKSQVP